MEKIATGCCTVPEKKTQVDHWKHVDYVSERTCHYCILMQIMQYQVANVNKQLGAYVWSES